MYQVNISQETVDYSCSTNDTIITQRGYRISQPEESLPPRAMWQCLETFYLSKQRGRAVCI